MATKVKQLSVLLTAKNATKKGLKSAQVSLRKYAKKASRLADRAGMLIGAGFATGIGLSIKSFIGLDSAMTKSLAITKNVSEQMRREMTKTAQTLSQSALFSAKELAEGYFFLTSAGKSLSQSQVLLGDVAKFAQAGQFDLATATTLLADAQKTLGMSSENVAKDQKSLIRVSDVLVKANTLANANVQQFSEALTNDAGPAMRAFGIDLEEGVAVLASYADRGIKGAEAGSMFGRMLRLLIPNASKNKKLFKELGIEVFNSEGNLNKMSTIVKQLSDTLGVMSVEQRSTTLMAMGFQKRMQNAIFPILGAGDAISKYEEELRKAGGTTGEVADKQLKSISAQFTLLQNNLNAVVAELLGFQEGADSLSEVLQNVNKFFEDDSVEWINTIRILAIETEFFFKGVMLTGEAFFFNVMTWMQEITDNIMTVFGWVKTNFTALLTNVGTLWVEWVKMLGRQVLIPFEMVFERLKAIAQILKNPTDADAWASALKEPISDFGGKMIDNVVTTMQNVSQKLDLEPPRFNKFKDQYRSVADEWMVLMKEKGIAIDKFTAQKIADMAGKPLESLGKGNTGKGDAEDSGKAKGKSSADSRNESSVISAVQKGTSEALKIQYRKSTTDKKIEGNTKKTVTVLQRIENAIKKNGIGDFTLPTIDPFGGGSSTA